MSPHVFIVVLNWNSAANTISCLNSLNELTYTKFDVVVVDNASSDCSVQEIGNLFPDIEVLQSQSNLGFGGGCNIGIRYALKKSADWIWLINNDAVVDAECLTALVAQGCGDDRLGAVGSVIYEEDVRDKVQLWGGGCVNLWLGRSQHRQVPGPLDFVSGASILLRATALECIGFFDEQSFFMYWEDTDLGFRLRNAGYRLGVAEGSQVWHKQSASLGKGSPLLDLYFIRSAVRFLRKHGPAPSMSAFCLMVALSGKRLLRGQFRRVGAIVIGYLGA